MDAFIFTVVGLLLITLVLGGFVLARRRDLPSHLEEKPSEIGRPGSGESEASQRPR
jgi:hypothetical protein